MVSRYKRNRFYYGNHQDLRQDAIIDILEKGGFDKSKGSLKNYYCTIAINSIRDGLLSYSQQYKISVSTLNKVIQARKLSQSGLDIKTISEKMGVTEKNVNRLLSYESPISPNVRPHSYSNPEKLDDYISFLPKDEQEILYMQVAGHSIQEIADSQQINYARMAHIISGIHKKVRKKYV